MTAATKTRSQLGKLSRDKGLKAERDICGWLRPVWPDVDRTQRTGYRTAQRQRRDDGDICGTPGIIWSVKDCTRHYLDAWWDELLEMCHEAPLAEYQVPIRLLVVKNTGHACPADWWCWQPLHQLVAISTGLSLPILEPGGNDLVRCRLDTVVTRLRIYGYGLPLDPAA